MRNFTHLSTPCTTFLRVNLPYREGVFQLGISVQRSSSRQQGLARCFMVSPSHPAQVQQAQADGHDRRRVTTELGQEVEDATRRRYHHYGHRGRSVEQQPPAATASFPAPLTTAAARKPALSATRKKATLTAR